MHISTVRIEQRFVRSTIGKGSEILSANGMLPKGYRLVVGENNAVYL